MMPSTPAQDLAVKMAVALMAVALGALSQYESEDDVLIIEKSAALPVSRIKAFQLLSDISSYHHWFPGVDKIEAVDNMNTGLGKHYVERQHWLLYGTIEYSYVIYGYESPKYISFVTNGWWHPRIEIILERRESEAREKGGQIYPTLITYRMHSRRRSYLVKYILAPAAQLMYSYKVRQGLFNLKYILQR